jgi:hypothetical protein
LLGLAWFGLADNVENFSTAAQGTDENTKWRMSFACWISRVQTHSEYVILIAFPRQ